MSVSAIKQTCAIVGHWSALAAFCNIYTTSHRLNSVILQLFVSNCDQTCLEVFTLNQVFLNIYILPAPFSSPLQIQNACLPAIRKTNVPCSNIRSN